ncbi:MAG: TetR/AcrR family transcriptional regulator [Thermodesulfobacteriota bacterium]
MSIQDRKEREKEMRRKQIQAAAKQLFMEKGYRATSIEDIAKLAELSPATIYLYFNSKDELYASLNRETLQFLVRELEKIKRDRSLLPEEKLGLVKEALYQTYLYDPLSLRIIFYLQLDDTLLNLDKEVLETMNKVGRQGLTLMAEIFEEGVAAGKFIPGQGMLHADIMWAIFAGVVMWEEAKTKMNPNKDFLKPTLFEAFDLFCRGLAREGNRTDPGG